MRRVKTRSVVSGVVPGMLCLASETSSSLTLKKNWLKRVR
jgi:hypothetical protein